MAATLALMAALLFAVAATLQQKGALNVDEVSLGNPKSLVQLVGQRLWLFGTAALLVGYALQAAALDRGRLAVIQPLLVTTIVFALPLGWWLTNQRVGRREVVGAALIVIGLAAFVIYGDPAGGKDNAPNDEWAIAITVLCALCAVLLLLGRRGTPTTIAAVYGTVAGILFGLSAALTKPTVELLHEGVGVMLSEWQCYALAIAGILGFILQQVSLGTGRLAPSVATVSVANPIVGVMLGILIFDERFSRPLWHVLVAIISLLLALGGAVLISLASRPGSEEEARPEPAESSTALA